MEFKNISIYFHWPFCESKCPYCDFNSHVRKEINHSQWLLGYLKNIENWKKNYLIQKFNQFILEVVHQV